jgi:hypothetical protein
MSSENSETESNDFLEEEIGEEFIEKDICDVMESLNISKSIPDSNSHIVSLY